MAAAVTASTVEAAAMESAAAAMRSVGDLGLTDHGGEQQCSCNAC